MAVIPYVAIVGAGPSGLYLADELTRTHPHALVDIYERLPCPFGLLRYGVAPDQGKVKAVMETLGEVLARPRVRFLGNVEVGVDLPVPWLRSAYHAVVYATGAPRARRVEVPGADLAGHVAAGEIVSWYNAHPDRSFDPAALAGASSVVVIGGGNVALDVARMLSLAPAALADTDVPADVLDALCTAPVSDIHVVYRAGAGVAKFSTPELRQLSRMEDVELLVATPLDAGDAPTRQGARNIALLEQWRSRRVDRPRRRIHFHFHTRPVALIGTDRVTGVVVERAGLGRATIPAQLVVSAIGFDGVPVPGLEFDSTSRRISHQDGEIVPFGAGAREFVTGWAADGAVGVLGTHRASASAIAARIVALAIPPLPAPDPAAVARRPVVTKQDWTAIDAAERELGRLRGTQRVKLTDRSVLEPAAIVAR